MVKADKEKYLKEGKRPCIKCGEKKEFSEFVVEKSTLLGIRAICKKCEHKKQNDKYNSPHTKLLLSYKKEGKRPCTKCGETKSLEKFCATKNVKSILSVKSVCKKCESKRRNSPRRTAAKKRNYLKNYGMTRNARQAKNLTDCYVRNLFKNQLRNEGINVHGIVVPEAFIEFKRQLINLRRIINNNKNMGNKKNKKDMANLKKDQVTILNNLESKSLDELKDEMSDVVADMARKLAATGTAFLEGKITIKQSNAAYRTLNAAGLRARDAYYIKRGIIQPAIIVNIDKSTE